MTLIIERLNGTRYNLQELGIRVVEFEPESLNARNTVVDLDGGGVVVQNDGYGSRYISASFRILPIDLLDYALFRSELFDLFCTLENFYIIDTKESYKRWHVRCDGSFSLSRAIRTGNFDINFVCVKIFAESVYSSLELQDNKKWDVDLWSWGMGLQWDASYRYTHTGNSFTVVNAGNATVDPSNWDLQITIKAVASQYIQITNSTTGDVYRYNGPLTNSDTLIIRGVRSLKNGAGVFGSTNRKLISLAPGNNVFSVTGANSSNITFDFKYPYK